jgi:hypothetical protein
LTRRCGWGCPGGARPGAAILALIVCTCGLWAARLECHATSALKTGRCNRPPVVTSEYATSASWTGSTHRVSCILTGLDTGGAARTCGSSARRIERAALRSQPVPTAPA